MVSVFRNSRQLARLLLDRLAHGNNALFRPRSDPIRVAFA
jgi:hypothetical protein